MDNYDQANGALSCSVRNIQDPARGSGAINRVKSGASWPIKQIGREQFQEQVHICGSITSSASSSGCSSVESTSIEPPSSSSSSSYSSSSPSSSSQVQGQQRKRLHDFNGIPAGPTTNRISSCVEDRINSHKVDDRDLEVDETLYLRGQRIRNSDVGKPCNLNGCCMINGCVKGGGTSSSKSYIEGQFANGSRNVTGNGEMSEFSAFTLQKSLTIARSAAKQSSSSARLQQITCDGSIKPKIIKRSSTVKVASSLTSSRSYPYACYCCCCSNNCSAVRIKNLSRLAGKLSSSSSTLNDHDEGRKIASSSTDSSPAKPGVEVQFPMENPKGEQVGISSALLRRATIIGRPLKSCEGQSARSSSHQRSIGRAEGDKLTKMALNRVQRPQVLRSLPVPPPVVPLFKEIALFGNKEEIEREKLSISSTNLDVDSKKTRQNSGPAKTQLDFLKTQESSDYKGNGCVFGTNKVNNNFVSAHEQTERLCGSPEFITTSTNNNNSGYHTTLAQSLLNIDKLSRVHDQREKFMGLSGSREKQKFYQDNWQNLDSFSYDRHSASSRRLRKGVANSCIYIAQKPGQVCREKVAPSYSCDSRAVSGNNLGSTLGRRTGKFLEKLRQSFMTNFSRSSYSTSTSTSTSITATTTTAISTLEAGAESDKGSSNTTIDKSDISEKNAEINVHGGPTEKELVGNYGEAIYDTPEYDGRHWLGGSVNTLERKMSRPAARPSIPPPPPPYPPTPPSQAVLLLSKPTVEAQRRVVSSNSMLARSSHELEGACVEVESATRRVDSIELAQLKPIQSSNGHQVYSKSFESIDNNCTHLKDNTEQLTDEKRQIGREKERVLILDDHKDSKKEHEIVKEQKCHQNVTNNCQKDQEENSSSLRKPILSSKLITKRRKAVQFADELNKTILRKEEITAESSGRNKLATFRQSLSVVEDLKVEDNETASVRGQERDFTDLIRDDSNNEADLFSKLKSTKQVETETRNNLVGGISFSQISGVNSETGASLGIERVKDNSRDIKMGSSQSVAIEAEGKSSFRSKRTAKTINFTPTNIGLDKKVSSSENGTSTRNSMKNLSSLTEKLVVGEASKLKTNYSAHKEASQTKSQVLRQQQQQQQQPHKLRQTVCSKFKLEGRAVDLAASFNLTATTATTTISSKIKRCSASITANASSTANQAQSMSTLAGSGTNMMSSRNLPLEDPLEKRRKSIQNGDVFIYPSLYKDLNECSKCARDNKICNCTVENERDESDNSNSSNNNNNNNNNEGGDENNIEPCPRLDELTSSNSTSTTTLTTTTITADKPQTHTTSTTVITRDLSITKTLDPIHATTAPSSKSSQVECSTFTLSDSDPKNTKTDCNSVVLSTSERAESFNKSIICNTEQQQQNVQQQLDSKQYCQNQQQQQHRNSSLSTRQTNSQLENQHQDYHWRQQSKTLYKISIATASIDQKSNLLRLASPKIIVPNESSLQSLSDKSKLDSNLTSPYSYPSLSSSTSASILPTSPASSLPPINISPPVPPRIITNGNSNNDSSNETINEYHSQNTNKAYHNSSQSSLNIISSRQKQLNSPHYNNTRSSISSSYCKLNTCNSSSEQATQITSPITAIAVNGTTAQSALDKTLSGNSVKKLDQRALIPGSTPLLNNSDNIYRNHSKLSYLSDDINYNGSSVYSSSPAFDELSSRQTPIRSRLSHNNLAPIYSKDERPDFNNTALEAKVTAISIGSPDRSPPSIDLEKLLKPLLVNNCELDSDKNGISNDRKESCENIIDYNNNINQKNIKQHFNGFERCFKEEAHSSDELPQQQQQLTCNLEIGDAIRITSTSICIGSSKQDFPSTKAVGPPSNISPIDLTSIIPIEPSPSRRRNINNKLNRQAIHEDDDDFDLSTTTSSNLTVTSYSSPTTTVATIDDGSSLTSQSILMSDLIKMDRDFGGNILITDEPSIGINNKDVLEYSPILTGVRDYIQNVNTELKVKTSPASPINEELALVTGHSSETSTALVVNPMTSNDSINSKVANLGSANFGTVHKTIELELPKKSIFDGASKDEILEYLEDARERVPEVLMAADDVMVISENELIVVNQLDPGSPATPISIVEASEVIESKSCNLDSDISDNSAAHPDKLRQHLQEMFQANFGSINETTDDETNMSSDQQIGLTSSIDVTNVTQQSESQLESSRRICNDLKAFSRVTGKTLDSFEDQLSNTENLSDVQKLESDVQNNIRSDQQQVLRDGRSSRQSVGTTTSSLSNTSNTSVGEVINASNLMNYSQSTMYTGRRNSTSETSPSARARSCVLQMMMLQKRYSNRDSKRDSLSSPSSSPPSSVSPSSTTSSNQTSGNCSAASTFYASSSLSSSSPLLAITGNAQINSPSYMKSSINSNINNTNNKTVTSNCRSVMTLQPSDLNLKSKVDRDDSGLGTDFSDKKIKTRTIAVLQDPLGNQVDTSGQNTDNQVPSNLEKCSTKPDSDLNVKLSVIDEVGKQQTQLQPGTTCINSNTVVRFKPPTFASSVNLMSRTSLGHNTTMNRLNFYFMNRHPSENNSETTIDFQCLDCDQFIDVDHSTMLNKTNEFRLLKESDFESLTGNSADGGNKDKPLTTDQLDRAYIAAMNGLPLCKTCEKKRIERKEIISEFVETELKYGRDLKIVHDEFYRPMRIAGLLSKDQINGVFLNLEELRIVHCKFADRLEAAIREAHSMGDVDYNTVNIGRLFVGSAEMLSAFESYCIRQGSAACLLARLAKEKELLRIFLRVSQMENTLLRRMNLAAFLMVPVQRVTKYPLLLNRLYKVTAYHHKDREVLRDAQLKVELHLEHINQQTKGFGATNKIWRRISNLSAPISNRRGLINAEDIGHIKLRKTAMDMLKWDRDETQFIHSGRMHFAPLNEFLTKQKMKPIRYLAAHALLIVLGKPNWKYRPDLVKANLDNKLMTPTPGGNGVKETALLLFREKNGRFVPCREPLFLSNCVLSNDCCQYNNECPQNQSSHHHNNSKSNSNGSSSSTSSSNARKVLAASAPIDCKYSINRQRTSSSDSNGNQQTSIDLSNIKAKEYEVSGDAVSMSSLKSLPEDQIDSAALASPTSAAHTSRSYSLASALPRTTITTAGSSSNLTKPTYNLAASNMTILNQLMTKVNNYHKQSVTSNKASFIEQNTTKNSNNASSPPTIPVTTTTTFGTQLTASMSVCSGMNQTANISSQQSQHHTSATDSSSLLNNARMIGGNSSSNNISSSNNNNSEIHQQYNHHYFHNHHQPYGDYEESFEIHERLSKESMLLRADTPLKTRYWLQMLRYHAKDLGQWRARRNGLANIMMMRQE